jgi:hypothetical protein
MGGTRTPGVTEGDPFGWVTPPSSPGTLGRHDRADPGARSAPGDTPGSAGVNDAAAALVAHAPVTAPTAGRDLTPLQFEALYHNLHVSYLDRASGLAQHVAVDVHIYSNNGIARRRSNMREKERLVGLVRAELRRAGGLALIDVADGDRERIAHAFYAKGSPEDCATTFRHVLRYGVSSPGAIQRNFQSILGPKSS